MRKLYERLASLVTARQNCIKSGNAEWRLKHTERALELVKEHMPSGVGFDCGTKLDLDKSTGERLVFETSFHHMDDNGYYDGWTDHVVRVLPAFGGIDMTISGRNRNEIKDYIHEAFHCCLTIEVPS
jgi:hypothetical protein